MVVGVPEIEGAGRELGLYLSQWILQYQGLSYYYCYQMILDQREVSIQ